MTGLRGGAAPMVSLLDHYPVPSETASEEQRDRFLNLDLPSVSGADLYRELTTLRVINFLHDSNWHLEREVAVSAELAARQRKKR